MAGLVAEEVAQIRLRGPHPTHLAVVHAIERIPGEGLKLLDVGCGAGLYCAVLEGVKRVRYEGADFNRVLIKRARRAFPGIKFYLADATELPFDDGSYDVVLAGAVLEHIPDWRRALGEMCRVAKQHLILHRTLLAASGGATRAEIQIAFQESVWRVYLNLADLIFELAAHGFKLADGGTFIDYDRRTAKGHKGEHWTFLCERAT